MISPALVSALRDKQIQLPTFDTVAIKLVEQLKKNGDANDVKELVQIIHQDMAIQAKVLRFTNAPVNGLKNNVISVKHAISLIGFNAVATIALTFKLADTYSGHKTNMVDYTFYWRRSVISAIAARQLASVVLGGDKETAFLAALLQDIGVLVFDQLLGDDYGKTIKSCDKYSHMTLAQIEKRSYECNHADIGAYILKTWHLPPIIYEAVANSHNMCQSADSLLNNCVAVSGWFAEIWLFGQDHDESKILAYGISHRLLNLDDHQIKAVIDGINTELFEDLGIFPGLNLEPLTDEKKLYIETLAQQLLLNKIEQAGKG